MTRQNNYTFAEDLAEKGLDAVPEMMRVLINNSMQEERSKCLQAGDPKKMTLVPLIRLSVRGWLFFHPKSRPPIRHPGSFKFQGCCGVDPPFPVEGSAFRTFMVYLVHLPFPITNFHELVEAYISPPILKPHDADYSVRELRAFVAATLMTKSCLG